MPLVLFWVERLVAVQRSSSRRGIALPVLQHHPHMLVHVLVVLTVGQRLGPFIAGKGEQIVGDDALVGGVRRRDLLPGGQVDDPAVPGLDSMIAGKFQCVGLVEHQIIPGEGDAVILFKGSTSAPVLS